MEETHILTTLILAFGLGMLHALDADHIMAVTGLASTRSSLGAGLRFCLRWAVGHGLTLLIFAAAVLLLGMAIPYTLSSWAESLVGVLLLVIGVWLFIDLIRRRAHLHFHVHDGLPAHAHWHAHDGTSANDHENKQSHRHDHRAMFVGVLHGVAGSAPLLALLPLAAMRDPALGLLYVVIFSLGVLLAMVLFGGLLGQLFNRMHRYGTRFIVSLRAVVALISVVYGTTLIYA